MLDTSVRKNYIIEWKPGDDYVLRLHDQTGEERSLTQFQHMLKKLRPILNEYGFDFASHGSWRGAQMTMLGELQILLRHEEDDDE